VAILLGGNVSGQEILLREGQTNTLPGTFTVPFAFYSGSLGPAVGASIGNGGFFQPQASAFATVVGSANGSMYGFLAIRADVGISDEGGAVQMTIDQPF
jgi:hypothetical protein